MMLIRKLELAAHQRYEHDCESRQPLPSFEEPHWFADGEPVSIGHLGIGESTAYRSAQLERQSRAAPFKKDRSKPAQTWIEIQLVDEGGLPIPNEKYELTLPNGVTIKGVL